MATTVTNLVDQSKQFGNIENSNFCSRTEIVGYLNDAAKKFVKEIVAVDDSVYQSTYDFNVSGSPNNNAALPADFLVQRAVKSQPDTPQEQTLYGRDIHDDGYDGKIGYHLDGQNIWVIPGLYATTGNPFRLYYIPIPTQFAESPGAGQTGTLDPIQDQYSEYFSTRAAIRIARKKRQDSLVLSLQGQLQEIRDDMKLMRQSEPKQAPVLWGGRRRQFVRRGWDDWDL